ncbi:DUF4328 domain-containing protein [Sphingopyxis sp.]|uniref:DUF4328 domain-containing protein n=1 Tax=Sphingopyxis sp. TaxID=1908224 RepID=UPI003D10E545
MAIMGLGEGIDLLERRARLLKFLLAGGFVLVAAVLIGEIAELSGLLSPAETAELSSGAILYLGVIFLDFLVGITTIIVFSMWIYRAAANIVAAEVHGFAYTPGWAVGWFFIPFANLVKPFAAIRQIWNASHGERNEKLDHSNGLLALWWGTWLVSNIAANISFRLTFNTTSPEEALLGLQVGIFSSIVSLALYLAAYKLVDQITAAQRERLTAANIFA